MGSRRLLFKLKFVKNSALGTILILRKVIGVGGWSRKWQFSLKMSLLHRGWVVLKSLKTHLPTQFPSVMGWRKKKCHYEV